MMDPSEAHELFPHARMIESTGGLQKGLLIKLARTYLKIYDASGDEMAYEVQVFYYHANHGPFIRREVKAKDMREFAKLLRGS